MSSLMLENPNWVLDDYKCWNLYVADKHSRPVHAFIQERPQYCDRGHYSLNIDGPLYLDEQDRFPRYYMSLKTAKEEAVKFLQWRLFKIRS